MYHDLLSSSQRNNIFSMNVFDIFSRQNILSSRTMASVNSIPQMALTRGKNHMWPVTTELLYFHIPMSLNLLQNIQGY